MTDFFPDELDFVGDGGGLDPSENAARPFDSSDCISPTRSTSASSPPSDRKAERSSVESRVNNSDSDVSSCKCAEE